MSHWQPGEVIGLAAVAAALVAALAWAAAWHSIRMRQVEASSLGPESLAALRLGRCLAGVWMDADGVRDVMAAFNALPPEARAPLALAVEGLVSQTGSLERQSLQGKVVALARSFKARPPQG